MAYHNELGKWGEAVAREYFIASGYAIVAENVRVGNVEIDLIVMKENRICFVEVKTRSTHVTDPADAIDRKKRMRMVRAADTYIRMFDVPHEPQFDILIVIGSEQNYEVEHIPDAFYPTLFNGY